MWVGFGWRVCVFTCVYVRDEERHRRDRRRDEMIGNGIIILFGRKHMISKYRVEEKKQLIGNHTQKRNTGGTRLCCQALGNVNQITIVRRPPSPLSQPDATSVADLCDKDNIRDTCTYIQIIKMLQDKAFNFPQGCITRRRLMTKPTEKSGTI